MQLVWSRCAIYAVQRARRICRAAAARAVSWRSTAPELYAALGSSVTTASDVAHASSEIGGNTAAASIARNIFSGVAGKS